MRPCLGGADSRQERRHPWHARNGPELARDGLLAILVQGSLLCASRRLLHPDVPGIVALWRSSLGRPAAQRCWLGGSSLRVHVRARPCPAHLLLGGLPRRASVGERRLRAFEAHVYVARLERRPQRLLRSRGACSLAELGVNDLELR